MQYIYRHGIEVTLVGWGLSGGWYHTEILTWSNSPLRETLRELSETVQSKAIEGYRGLVISVGR